MSDLSPAKLVEDPHAPEMYVSQADGFGLDGPNVKITFSSNRGNHLVDPNVASRVVVGRLVLPLAKARILGDELLKFLDKVASLEKPTST